MKGYLLFALNADADGQREYTKLAYACALSIKLTQPDGYNSVSVVTNDVLAFKNYKSVFDNIIEYNGPEGMDARSRAYDYTPYEETVLLDADMLFLQPMNHYWDMMGQRELFITTTPQNYRRDVFVYGHYRQLMQKNKWPDVYNAWTYFKKPSKSTGEFFELVKTMTDNPKQFINMFMPDTMNKTIPTDEAFALALCILDMYEQSCPAWDFPRITHMKPGVQLWKEGVADWTDKLRFSLAEDGQVKLGVWQQTDLLHYVKKALITDDVIKTLEKAYE
jgi:hypothetical protein